MDQKFLILIVLLFLLSSCSSRYPTEPPLPVDGSFLSLEDGLSYFNPGSISNLLSGAVTADSVDVPLSDAKFVYKYYYIYHDGKWEKKSFSGASESDTGWILVGKDTLTVKKLFQDSNGYVAVYSCSSRSCSGEGWKVHEFEFTSPATAPDVMPGSTEAASPSQPALKPVISGSTSTNPYGFKRTGRFSSSAGSRIPVVLECVSDSSCSYGFACNTASNTCKPTYCGDDYFHLAGSQRYLWQLDFEDLNDDGWILGWTVPGQSNTANAGIPTFQLDTSEKRNGVRSLKISSNSTNTSGVISISTPSALRMVAGETYTLSYWAKAVNETSLTNHMTVFMIIGNETASGSISYSNVAYWFTAFPTGTYNWTHVISNYTAPANQNAITPNILFQNGNGTVWLDDIMVLPALDYNSLPKTTIDVAMRVSDVGESPHHYFTRSNYTGIKAVLHNRNATSGSYEVQAKLYYCNQLVQSFQQAVNVSANSTVNISLFNLNTSRMSLGDYYFQVNLSENNEVIDSVAKPFGLRLDPTPDFLFSIGTFRNLNSSDALSVMNRLEGNYTAPLIYGGEPPSFVADAALSKNMPFIIRVMPTFTYLPKKGAHGEAFNTYTNGLSNDTMWYEAAELIKTAVQWSSHFQGFFPIVYTSDDFSIHGGWDWADKNVERMYSLYGINISNNSNSIPAEINNTVPDYYSVDVFTSKTKGNISVNDSWLVYNQFVSKDVLGTYNQRVVQKVVNATSNARVGPIPGGMQWPLFSISNGQYPPYNFGNSSFNGGNTSFNMVSYYMYLNYWRPELAYIYWTDIARMGSRDLPVYVMPDALMTEESYIWNNFYLLLAAGVNGVSYFVDDDSSDTIQFWNVTNQRIGPMITKYGSLFTKLQPTTRPVGLLSSLSTTIYHITHPLDDLCAYVNLLMAHVDVEPVSEEEILAGRMSQYSAIIMEDIDWLRNDVVQNLSSANATGSPSIIRDNRTEVNISGSHVTTWLNLSLAPMDCATNGDYAQENHLSQIRSAVGSAVSPTVIIENNTVIYRKYQAGDAYYFWLVNVHSFEEYQKGLDWFTYRGGISNTTAQQEVINYFANRSIYNGSITTNVSVLVPTGMTAVDVLSGSTLSASWNGNWSMFDVTIPRLAGKLIALYPAAPDSVSINFSSIVSLGYQATLRTSVLDSAGNLIRAAFPLYVEIIDPAGRTHSYTRYTATNTTGSYDLPITIGANDPTGSWTLRVTELSTNKQNSVGFSVS